MTRSPLVLTLAFIFGVALAPAAAAQAPAAGTVLTGGSLAAGLADSSELSLRVLPGGRVAIRSVSYLTCRRGTSEVSGRGTGRINPDGTFRVRLLRRTAVELRGFRRSIRVDGTFAAGQATGTTTATSSGAGARGCRGTSRWTARPSRTVGTAPAPVPAGATLLGRTSGKAGGPFGVIARVAANGRRIPRMLISYRVRCGKVKPYEETDISRPIAVNADGTFRLVERFALRYADATERWKVTIRGRFVEGGLRAVLRGSAAVRARRGGRVIDRCATGRVRFTASTL